jgi:hypothetical protein
MGTSPSSEELAALAAVLAVLTSGDEERRVPGIGFGSPPPGFSPWAYHGRIRLVEGRRGFGGRKKKGGVMCGGAGIWLPEEAR